MGLLCGIDILTKSRGTDWVSGMDAGEAPGREESRRRQASKTRRDDENAPDRDAHSAFPHATAFLLAASPCAFSLFALAGSSKYWEHIYVVCLRDANEGLIMSFVAEIKSVADKSRGRLRFPCMFSTSVSTAQAPGQERPTRRAQGSDWRPSSISSRRKLLGISATSGMCLVPPCLCRCTYPEKWHARHAKARLSHREYLSPALLVWDTTEKTAQHANYANSAVSLPLCSPGLSDPHRALQARRTTSAERRYAIPRLETQIKLFAHSRKHRERGERVFERVHTEGTPRDRGRKAATATYGTHPSDVRSTRNAVPRARCPPELASLRFPPRFTLTGSGPRRASRRSADAATTLGRLGTHARTT